MRHAIYHTPFFIYVCAKACACNHMPQTPSFHFSVYFPANQIALEYMKLYQL